jgi:hypothetical protein
MKSFLWMMDVKIVDQNLKIDDLLMDMSRRGGNRVYFSACPERKPKVIIHVK